MRRWAALVAFSLLAGSAVAQEGKPGVEDFIKGTEAFGKQDMDAAMAAFQKALEVNPELLWPSHYYLGLGFHSKNDNDNAAEHYLAFMEKSEETKDDEEIAKMRSFVLTKIGIALARTGDSGRAIPYLEQAVATNPEDKESLYLLAVELTKANRPREAETNFNKVIELDPAMADAHFILGNMAFTKGDSATARTRLTEYLELQPKSPRAALVHFMLGSMLMRQSQGASNGVELQARAKTHYERALVINPSFNQASEANYILGAMALQKENYDLAVKYFRRYLQLEPSGSHAAEVKRTLDDIK